MRAQAARAALDAGVQGDAAQAESKAAPPSEPAKAKPTPRSPGQAGAGGGASKAKAGSAGAAGSATINMPQAGAGAASEPTTECDEACRRACEQACGACQACGKDNKTCEPVLGADDADSCSDMRSCSSRGSCLDISEAQTEVGDMLEWAELTTSYAQVINFSAPARIEEIRLEVSCTENAQTFPPAWIVAAPGGVPSSNMIATANVLAQAPTEHNTFALLELSKVLEQPATGPIAIVVGMTDKSCLVRVNSAVAYPGGNLFMQGAAGLWVPSEGAMVFQVLSSK